MRAYERLLNYVVVRTPSDEHSTTSPSSQCQFDLARILADEMTALGISDVSLDEFCYVYGKIPATPGYENKPSIGFIAHMDTVSDYCDHDIIPVVHKNYDGGDLPLGTSGRTLTVKDFPHLPSLAGRTLITTDGTTVLGADDKAGIAEIVSAVVYLKEHPEIKHGKIRIGFNPDEEIGLGAHKFNVAQFGCEWAYTIDGGQIGELEYENFNAAGAKVVFKGLNVHPGYAKDKMLNASLLAVEFASWLPVAQRPEHTTGYEGFFHLTGISGTVEEASLSYIIRDHVRTAFERKKELLHELVKRMNEMHPGSTTLELRDQYYNMREVVEPKKFIVDLAFDAMKEAGVTPLVKPIRGGTDGARLSFMGLPCPNIFAGGLNFHGRYEFLPVKSLEKSMETIVKIAELLVKGNYTS